MMTEQQQQEHRRPKRRVRRDDKFSLTMMQKPPTRSPQSNSFSAYKDNPYFAAANDYTSYLDAINSRLTRPRSIGGHKTGGGVVLPVGNGYIVPAKMMSRPGSQARTGNGAGNFPGARQHLLYCYGRSHPRRRPPVVPEQIPPPNRLNSTYNLSHGELVALTGPSTTKKAENRPEDRPTKKLSYSNIAFQDAKRQQRTRTPTPGLSLAGKLRRELPPISSPPKPPAKVPELDVERLMSFCPSTSQLAGEDLAAETEEEAVKRAAQVKPYAMIRDEMKPVFFFNVRAKKHTDNESSSRDSDINTPSFIESFREDPAGVNPHPRPSGQDESCTPGKVIVLGRTGPVPAHEEGLGGFCPMISLNNGPDRGKGNIYINKTTIINNIISQKEARRVFGTAANARNLSGAAARRNVGQKGLSKSFVTSKSKPYCI